MAERWGQVHGGGGGGAEEEEDLFPLKGAVYGIGTSGSQRFVDEELTDEINTTHYSLFNIPDQSNHLLLRF